MSDTAEVVTDARPSAEGWRSYGRELRSSRSAMLGVAVLVLVILAAVLAPLLARHDPATQDLRGRLLPPIGLDGATWDHPLGTDGLGRDVLSRLLFGARATLQIASLVILFAGFVGVSLGIVAGYYGGIADAVVMRLVDAQFAIPGLLLAIALLAVRGPGVASLVIVLSVLMWMVFARVVRASVLTVSASDYIEAAETLGCGRLRILTRHVLPNIASPVLTLVVMQLAAVVLSEASLSFLGLGVQPPETSWGLDVANGRSFVTTAWWLVTFPGLAIAGTVLAANMVAGWLRVVADPHEREKQAIQEAA